MQIKKLFIFILILTNCTQSFTTNLAPLQIGGLVTLSTGTCQFIMGLMRLYKKDCSFKKAPTRTEDGQEITTQPAQPVIQIPRWKRILKSPTPWFISSAVFFIGGILQLIFGRSADDPIFID